MNSVLEKAINRIFFASSLGLIVLSFGYCKVEQDADVFYILPLVPSNTMTEQNTGENTGQIGDEGNSQNDDSNNNAGVTSSSCGLNFTSFAFTQAANSLNQNYTGTIGTNTVTASLPYGRIVRGIASFQVTENTAVQVSGVDQISGTSSNNFSSPMNYTLSRANCSSVSITVNVVPISPVQDTGQEKCYDSGSQQVCTSGAVVTDHPRQDGIVSSANGKSLLASASTTFNDRITVDQVTGLIWNSCLIGQDPANNCSGGATPMNQADAVTNCSELNNRNASAGYAGLKFWRLPTIQELKFITYHDDGQPFIHSTRFPNIVTGNSAWSITDNINNAAEGFRLRYVSGNFLNMRADTDGRFALCVSGGSPPARSWNTINNEEVQDLRSGLTWKRCTTGRTYPGCTGANPEPNWQAALQQCANLGARWRLPNSNELVSLYDYSNASNGMDATIFPNVVGGLQYWSSNTNSQPGSENTAFAMNSNGEFTTMLSKSTNTSTKAYCVQDTN